MKVPNLSGLSIGVTTSCTMVYLFKKLLGDKDIPVFEWYGNFMDLITM